MVISNQLFMTVQQKIEVIACLFTLTCLQALLIYQVYRNRPNRIPLQFLEQIVPEISPKLIRENLHKLSYSQGETSENILVKTGEGE